MFWLQHLLALAQGHIMLRIEIIPDAFFMKILIALMVAMSASVPSLAGEYQPGYSKTKTCTRNEYREEYVPGSSESNPGYVKSWNETIEVPCSSRHSSTNHRHAQPQAVDDNDCSEGTVAGGLLGGGIATAVSRGKDRWWAIPAGIVGGSMVGCSIDGG